MCPYLMAILQGIFHGHAAVGIPALIGVFKQHSGRSSHPKAPEIAQPTDIQDILTHLASFLRTFNAHFPFPLPILPNNVREHTPHYMPMPNRTAHLRCFQTSSLASSYDGPLSTGNFVVERLVDLMLRYKMLSPCRTSKKIRLHWFPESKRSRRFSAKDYDVGEILCAHRHRRRRLSK